MKSSLRLLILLALTLAEPAVAQDAGGRTIAATGSSQGGGATAAGNGSASSTGGTAMPSTGDAMKSDKGSAKGGAVDVDMAFAPKGKGAKGVTSISAPRLPAVASPVVKPRPVGKQQAPAANAAAVVLPTAARVGTQTARTLNGAGLQAGTVPSGNRASSPSGVPSAGISTPGISGTDLMRPAARTAAVGSLPKAGTGALSGSSFAPRHP